MQGPALIKEQCGSSGDWVTYTKDDDDRIVRLSQPKTLSNSLVGTVQDILRDVFLPHGYPDSVSDDYMNYQIWDTIQAFCSTITGTFTTQSVLTVVGVGDADARPLAAAITWILKDGTGMLGRIVFAWWKGNKLDADCKKWRLFADLINDLAMFLELLVPNFPNYSLQVLCLTTTMKAVVGVAGGATRASITQHQAIKGNMADVSAKDSSQETCVNLVASIVGIILLALFNDNHQEWTVFIIFATVHLIANYFAVTSLVFTHLNNFRLLLLMKMYLKFDTVANPTHINKKESVILGCGLRAQDLCRYKIEMGASLKTTLSILSGNELEDMLAVYEDRGYIIVPNLVNRTVYVALQHNERAEDVIAAYFHAVMVGIALCRYNNEPQTIQLKRHLHQATPLIRLNTVVKPRSDSIEDVDLTNTLLNQFNDYISFELNNFFTALKVNGWNVETHAIEVGLWRYVTQSTVNDEYKKKYI